MNIKRYSLENRLPRPRLEQELSTIFRHSVTVVSAPSGYGKTTIVRDYLSRQIACVFWLKLFWDRDPDTCFWEELVRAVGRHSVSAGEQLRAIGFPQSNADCILVADLLEEVSSGNSTVLVLDNYDQVESPRLNKMLQFLLERVSDHFHVVILCRRQLKFYLHGYFYSSRCNLIGKRVLSLDVSEVSALADQMERLYTPQELQWITEYTGGWISFVDSLLSASRRKGINRFYCAQLAARIYSSVINDELIGQEPEILMVLSLLGEFTAEQAAFLLGEDQHDRLSELLDRLSIETVFLEKSEDRYVICGAALEYLRAEESKSDSPVVRLGEQNLVRHYLSSGSPGDAIQLLYSREDLEGILRVLEEHTIEQISKDTGLMLMQSFQSSGFSLLSTYPVAAIQIAFLMLKTESFVESGKRLLLQLREYALQMDHPVYSREYILSQIDLALSNKSERRLLGSSLIQLAKEQAQSRLSKPSPWIVPNLLCGFHHTTGSMLAEVESFKALCAEERSGEELSDVSAALSCSDILQAEYYLETGDLSKATYFALRGIPEERQRRQSLLSLCGTFILAKATLFGGDWEQAASLLEGIRVDPNCSNNDRLSNMVDICKGYVYACMEKCDQIPAWIYENEKDSLRICQYSFYAYIIKAKELNSRKEFLKFELMSKEWESMIRSNQNLLAEIHYHIQKSVSALALYGAQLAVEELNTAFSLALPDEIVMPFVENGKQLLPILRYAADNQTLCLPNQYSETLSSLLTSFLRQPVSLSGKDAALTRREMEILQLLSQGLNYREIADCLVISQFTVRKHIQNIYAKLNVSDRVNALLQARQLSLADWKSGQPPALRGGQ